MTIVLRDNYDELRFDLNGNAEYRRSFKEPYEMRAFKKTINKTVTLKKGQNVYNLKLKDLGGHVVEKKVVITKK